jgi:hypothetical protein
MVLRANLKTPGRKEKPGYWRQSWVTQGELVAGPAPDHAQL